MDTNEIVRQIEEEINRLQMAANLLRGASGPRPAPATRAAAPEGRRQMSAEARARISEAQRRRHAAEREQAAAEVPPVVAVPPAAVEPPPPAPPVVEAPPLAGAAAAEADLAKMKAEQVKGKKKR